MGRLRFMAVFFGFFALCSSQAMALEGTFCPNPGFDFASNISCEQRDSFVNKLDGGVILFGSITFAASCLPTPFTKLVALVSGGAGAAVGAIDYFVKNTECIPGSELKDGQKAEVVRLICDQLGRSYVAGNPGYCAAQ